MKKIRKFNLSFKRNERNINEQESEYCSGIPNGNAEDFQMNTKEQ